MSENDPIQNLKSKLAMVESAKTFKPILEQFVQSLLNTTRQLKPYLESFVSQKLQPLTLHLREIDESIKDIKDMHVKHQKDMAEKLRSFKDMTDTAMEDIYSTIPILPDFKGMLRGVEMKIPASYNDTELRDAVKEFAEEIAKLKKFAATPQRVQTPAKAYRIYTKDVSDQCDGANKTFGIGGSHFGIVGVFGTDFPINYRPVIDYTETRTGIELTSAVPAPSEGATLVIQFLK